MGTGIRLDRADRLIFIVFQDEIRILFIDG